MSTNTTPPGAQRITAENRLPVNFGVRHDGSCWLEVGTHTKGRHACGDVCLPAWACAVIKEQANLPTPPTVSGPEGEDRQYYEEGMELLCDRLDAERRATTPPGTTGTPGCRRITAENPRLRAIVNDAWECIAVHIPSPDELTKADVLGIIMASLQAATPPTVFPGPEGEKCKICGGTGQFHAFTGLEPCLHTTPPGTTGTP